MEPLTLKLSIETTPDMDHTQVADARLVLRRELEDAPFAEFVEVPAAEAGPAPAPKGAKRSPWARCCWRCSRRPCRPPSGS